MNTKVFYLFILTFNLMLLSSLDAWSQHTVEKEKFDVQDHDQLVYAMTVVKTRMASYKDLVEDWRSIDTAKYKMAKEKYGKVQAAANGLVSQYQSLIENNRPRRVRIERIRPNFERFVDEFNDFVDFYSRNSVSKPSFAVTTATIELIIGFAKSIDEFVRGRIKEKREKLISQIEKCRILDWSVDAKPADKPKEVQKKDSTKSRGNL